MSLRAALSLLALTCALAACGGGGGGDESATAPSNRLITAQPVDQQVVEGDAAVFEVTAPGAATYLWQSSRDGVTWEDLPVTGRVLVVGTSDRGLDGTRYRVIATDARGSDTSATVTLHVAVGPARFAAHPAPTSAMAGGTASFSVATLGSVDVLQWESSADGGATWTALAGATQAQLVLNDLRLGQDGMLVRATVRNAAGTTASNAVRLTVTPDVFLPVFSVHPVDTSVPAGQPARFSASVQGESSATRQWQVSLDGGGIWSDLAGARDGALWVRDTSAAADGRRYRMRATYRTSTATSPAATLRVTAAPTRNLAVLAGSPGGPGGADGPSAEARFSHPAWTAVDTRGVVYVTSGCAIRRVAPDGWVDTVAGSRLCGDRDGVGADALMNQPTGLALTPDGDLYVADAANRKVRRVAADGTVTTIAGSGPSSATPRDGAGAAAVFDWIGSVARDAAGNLYVAETLRHTIRKISPDGVVTTFAGQPGVAGSANGPRETASFNQPAGLAVDAHGGLYVADSANAVVRYISPLGLVDTVAGVAGSTGSADGSRGTARLRWPMGVATGRDGEVYVSDGVDHTVRVLQPDGSLGTLAGGAGVPGAVDGDRSAARFRQPVGIAVDGNGRLVVADQWNHTLRTVDTSGRVTTLAGRAALSGSTDGVGPTASFTLPKTIGKDAAGNLYVGDSAVRRISPSGVTRTFHLGGSGGATFTGASAVAIDAGGTMYVADYWGAVIRRITPDGASTVLAGRLGISGHADGNGDAARFTMPTDITMDPQGILYVTDGSTIRRVTPAGDVSTWVGRPGGGLGVDGPADAARLSLTLGVVADAAGNLFVTETNCIRKVAADRSVTTVAGSCEVPGSLDGRGSAALFHLLWGIDVDADGNLYVADRESHTIRKVTPSGDVTTVLGTARIGSLVTGANPLLNLPYGVRVLDPKRLAVTSEGAVLVYTMP